MLQSQFRIHVGHFTHPESLASWHKLMSVTDTSKMVTGSLTILTSCRQLQDVEKRCKQTRRSAPSCCCSVAKCCMQPQWRVTQHLDIWQATLKHGSQWTSLEASPSMILYLIVCNICCHFVSLI